MMRLNQLLCQLREKGIGKTGTWEIRGRRGITIGDPAKYFPYQTGPVYQFDLTDDPNPELTPEEAAAIERRFEPNGKSAAKDSSK
ncbi:MAG TPA: hypothetical protein VMX16_05440 [Terriglobia bacterium]|nr:hypothetical protein [Terriglobia bacterium]